MGPARTLPWQQRPSLQSMREAQAAGADGAQHRLSTSTFKPTSAVYTTSHDIPAKVCAHCKQPRESTAPALVICKHCERSAIHPHCLTRPSVLAKSTSDWTCSECLRKVQGSRVVDKQSSKVAANRSSNHILALGGLDGSPSNARNRLSLDLPDTRPSHGSARARLSRPLPSRPSAKISAETVEVVPAHDSCASTRIQVKSSPKIVPAGLPTAESDDRLITRTSSSPVAPKALSSIKWRTEQLVFAESILDRNSDSHQSSLSLTPNQHLRVVELSSLSDQVEKHLDSAGGSLKLDTRQSNWRDLVDTSIQNSMLETASPEFVQEGKTHSSAKPAARHTSRDLVSSSDARLTPVTAVKVPLSFSADGGDLTPIHGNNSSTVSNSSGTHASSIPESELFRCAKKSSTSARSKTRRAEKDCIWRGSPTNKTPAAHSSPQRITTSEPITANTIRRREARLSLYRTRVAKVNFKTRHVESDDLKIYLCKSTISIRQDANAESVFERENATITEAIYSNGDNRDNKEAQLFLRFGSHDSLLATFKGGKVPKKLRQALRKHSKVSVRFVDIHDFVPRANEALLDPPDTCLASEEGTQALAIKSLSSSQNNTSAVPAGQVLLMGPPALNAGPKPANQGIPQSTGASSQPYDTINIQSNKPSLPDSAGSFAKLKRLLPSSFSNPTRLPSRKRPRAQEPRKPPAASVAGSTVIEILSDDDDNEDDGLTLGSNILPGQIITDRTREATAYSEQRGMPDKWTACASSSNGPPTFESRGPSQASLVAAVEEAGNNTGYKLNLQAGLHKAPQFAKSTCLGRSTEPQVSTVQAAISQPYQMEPEPALPTFESLGSNQLPRYSDETESNSEVARSPQQRSSQLPPSDQAEKVIELSMRPSREPLDRSQGPGSMNSIPLSISQSPATRSTPDVTSNDNASKASSELLAKGVTRVLTDDLHKEKIITQAQKSRIEMLEKEQRRLRARVTEAEKKARNAWHGNKAGQAQRMKMAQLEAEVAGLRRGAAEKEQTATSALAATREEVDRLRKSLNEFMQPPLLPTRSLAQQTGPDRHRIAELERQLAAAKDATDAQRRDTNRLMQKLEAAEQNLEDMGQEAEELKKLLHASTEPARSGPDALPWTTAETAWGNDANAQSRRQDKAPARQGQRERARFITTPLPASVLPFLQQRARADIQGLEAECLTTQRTLAGRKQSIRKGRSSVQVVVPPIRPDVQYHSLLISEEAHDLDSSPVGPARKSSKAVRHNQTQLVHEESSSGFEGDDASGEEMSDTIEVAPLNESSPPPPPQARRRVITDRDIPKRPSKKACNWEALQEFNAHVGVPKDAVPVVVRDRFAMKTVETTSKRGRKQKSTLNPAFPVGKNSGF